MSGSVEELQIEINATASKANDALDKLVGKLDRLSNSVGKLNVSNFSGFAVGVKNLSSAMSGLQNITMPDYTRTAKGIEKLASLDTGTITRAANSIGQLGKSLKVLDVVNIGDNAKQFAELATAIAKLGYKSSTQAIQNIPQLATAMKQLMTTLSKAPRVSQNLIDMTNALAKLARTGSSSGKAVNSLTKYMNLFSNSSAKAEKKSISLASAIGKLYASYWALFRVAGKLGDAINIASDLTEVQNVVNTTFGSYSSLVEEMASNSIANFGMSELTVKQVASRFQAMGTAMGFAQGKMADMSIELTKLTADMASFYNVEQSDVAEDLESIFTGQTRPLRTYGLDLTEATLKEWAMKQGLDANIDSMSQAEKTMLRYQYVMANTTNAQGDFARTADTWANQTRILKQNLEQLGSVIGGTLINALKPLVKALNTVIGKFIEFAKAVSDSLGKIFGWKYETTGGGITTDLEDASGYADGVSSGLGDAADNAKKLKQQLRGIDELNVITSTDSSGNSGSGSGSGSGSDSSGSGSSGEWTKVDSIFKDYESELDNLYKLGEYIGETLTNTLNNINWDNVYEGARNFGTGLADFLNGLISPELFGAVGRTIANSLNTAIYVALSFGQTFDFYDFGVSIATGINEFFENFDFEALGTTINTWVQGILTTIKTVIANVDWWNVFRGIWDGFKELDFSTIMILGVTLMVKKLKDLFGSEIIKQQVGSFIMGKIADSLGGTSLIFPTEAIASSIVPLIAIFASLATGLGLVYSKNEEVRQSFHDATNSIKEGLQPAIEFLSEKVLPDLKNAWDKIIDILKPFADFLEGVFTDVWQEMINPALSYIGETVLPNLTEVFENLWNNVLVPFGQFLGNVLKPVIEIVSSVLTKLWENVVVPLAQAVGGVLSEAFQAICDIYNKTVIPAVGRVIDVFNFLWNNVFSPIVNFLWDVFEPVFDTVFSGIKSIIDGLKTTFNGLINFVTGIFTGDWKRAWNGVKDVFSGIWQSLSSAVKTPLNAVISLFEGLANKVVDAFNWIKKSLNKLSFKIPDWVPDVGGKKFGFNFSTTGYISIPRFEEGGYLNNASLFWAGENGIPELLGTVNGQSAVAGGAEITGIRDAIYLTSRQELEMMKEQNMLLRGILEKEFGITTDDIGVSARKYAKEYYNRTGREAYSF